MDIRRHIHFNFRALKSGFLNWRAKRELAKNAKILLKKITFNKFSNQIPFWYKLKRLGNRPVFYFSRNKIKFKRIRTKFALKMNFHRY